MNGNVDNRTSGGETDRGPQRNPGQGSNVSGEEDRNEVNRKDQQVDELTKGKSNSTGEEEINRSTTSEPSQSPGGNRDQDQKESSGSAEAEADTELDAEAGAEASSDGAETEADANADAEAQGSAGGDTGYNNARPERQQQPETSYGY